jgi:hypothetical protein
MIGRWGGGGDGAGFFHPFSFLGLSRNLSEIPFFSGISAPEYPWLSPDILTGRPKMVQQTFESQKRLQLIMHGAAGIVPDPRLIGGAVGAYIVTAGSDTDEESVKSSSTSPAFKQKAIAVCGYHGIKKPAQAQWAAHSVRGVCIVHSSGSAQIQAANRCLSYQQQLQLQLRENSSS